MSTRRTVITNRRPRLGLAVEPDRHRPRAPVERHLEVRQRAAALRRERLRAAADVDRDRFLPVRGRHDRDDVPRAVGGRVAAALAPFGALPGQYTAQSRLYSQW